MAVKSRKVPKQKRSIVTVASILEATTHILLEAGAQALTTNHVAERAGVSIGSLYQYFPNKESLIAALIDKHVQEEVNALLKVIQAHQGRVSTELFYQLVKTFIDVHLKDLELTKLLHQQVNSLECRESLKKATQFFQQLAESLLATELNLVKDESVIKIKAFILTNTIDSLVQTALLEDSELLKDPLFITELVEFIEHIFQRKFN